MNIPALDGIVSAIEAESRQPSPSHNNLARLVALFMRELLKDEQLPALSPEPESPPPTEEKPEKTHKRKK